MKFSNTASRHLPLGTVLMAALALGACGGGGSSGTPPAASPPAALPSVASLGCSNVQGGGSGYVMGVCVSSDGNFGGILQNYGVTVARNPAADKSYNLSLSASPSGVGNTTALLAGEDCTANGVGDAFMYSTVALDVAGASTGPQWKVQSVNETFYPNPIFCGVANRPDRSAAYFQMQYLDGGLIERLATDSAARPLSTYLAGWISPLSSVGNFGPVGAKSFTNGKSIARIVTQVAGSYGIDAPASATVSGSTITISLSNFNYRRDNTDGSRAALPSSSHRLGSVTMVGTISGATFSGTVSGSDLTGASGSVTGVFEGTFGGAGVEAAARYAIKFTGNSSTVVGSVFLK